MKASPTEPGGDTKVGEGAEKAMLLSRTTGVGDQRAGPTVVATSLDVTSSPPPMLQMGMSQHGLSSHYAPGVAQPSPKTPTKYERDSERLGVLGAHITNVRVAYYLLNLSSAMRGRNLCPQNSATKIDTVYTEHLPCVPLFCKSRQLLALFYTM